MLINVTRIARNRRKVILPKSVEREEESSNVVSGNGVGSINNVNDF